MKISKADTALGHVNKLYHIERQINGLKEKGAYTPKRDPAPLAYPEWINNCWSIDFMNSYIERFNRTYRAEEMDMSV